MFTLQLIAMKIFASRSVDYMRVASKEDRRYLLYNPMVKMKITTQGEEVIDLIWDVIAAKGFEKDMYFEMAARDIRALPKLEGTVHVNMALVIKFMANYFFKPKKFSLVAFQDQQESDEFLFNQGTTRGLGKIQFHDYKIAYNSVCLPNVRKLKKQIKLLKMLLIIARPNKKQVKDIDFLLILGELFSIVVYGQLIIEKFTMDNMDMKLLDQIFDFLVRDFSKHALRLSSKPSSTFLQRKLCRCMLKKACHKQERFDYIWNEYVYPLNDKYEMNE